MTQSDRSLSTEPQPVTVDAPAQRNLAVDAFRGLVMCQLILSEVLSFSAISASYPRSVFWRVLAINQTHVEWSGMSLHDMIQPAFTFLVGVAVPYSVASRMRKGESFPWMFAHTVWRSLALVLLGIFLRSTSSTSTNFTFEDTLTQIGLGYTGVFLVAYCRPRWQWITLGTILAGYWLAWALYPAPSASFDYGAVGVNADWHYNFTGFAAHWNKNSNLGNAFDVWFLNCFPRPKSFAFNSGGYVTLSFIPTLATMLLGLIAGRWTRTASPKSTINQFTWAGSGLMLAGLLLHFASICPIVKRIWTPSWTLWSGGICFLTLAFLSWVVDVKGHRRLAFPLVVVGMNSLAAYLTLSLWKEFIMNSFRIHFGRVLDVLGPSLEPLTVGIAAMMTYWLIFYWMYNKKLFLRL
jgi:predicted acyltransferase